MARLGAQSLMQAALEAEITGFPGWDRYQRAAACEDARPGSRNGYREVTVKTTAGPVTLARPKLHHRDGGPVRGDPPGGDEMPARRPRRAHRLPAVPAVHHHRIRHPDFTGRTFGETRRRTKVIGLVGQTSCLILVWAVLDRASRGWRGLTMTGDGLRLLQDLRRSLLDPPRQLRPRTATTRDDERTTTSAPPPDVAINPNRARPFLLDAAPAGGRDGSGAVVGRISFTSPANGDKPNVLWRKRRRYVPLLCVRVARVTLISPAT